MRNYKKTTDFAVDFNEVKEIKGLLKSKDVRTLDYHLSEANFDLADEFDGGVLKYLDTEENIYYNEFEEGREIVFFLPYKTAYLPKDAQWLGTDGTLFQWNNTLKQYRVVVMERNGKGMVVWHTRTPKAEIDKGVKPKQRISVAVEMYVLFIDEDYRDKYEKIMLDSQNLDGKKYDNKLDQLGNIEINRLSSLYEANTKKNSIEDELAKLDALELANRTKQSK